MQLKTNTRLRQCMLLCRWIFRSPLNRVDAAVYHSSIFEAFCLKNLFIALLWDRFFLKQWNNRYLSISTDEKLSHSLKLSCALQSCGPVSYRLYSFRMPCKYPTVAATLIWWSGLPTVMTQRAILARTLVPLGPSMPGRLVGER